MTDKDFQPVVPNIIDHDMIGSDKDDNSNIRRRKKKTKKKGLVGRLISAVSNDGAEREQSSSEDHDVENTRQNKRTVNSNSDCMTRKNDPKKSSKSRKIVIGVLVVIIIIMVIILIYQLWKLYKHNELEEASSGERRKSSVKKKNRQNDIDKKGWTEDPIGKIKDSVKSVKNKITETSINNDYRDEHIPKSVRNLDDDILKRYIKTTESAPKNPQTNNRQVAQQQMSQEIDEAEKQLKLRPSQAQTMMESIEQQKLETLHENDYDESLSMDDREELVKHMKEDMAKEANNPEPIIESDDEELDGLVDEIADEQDDPDSGGCQFTLVRGNRIGQICGRKLSTDNRCHNHKYK